MPGSRVYDLAVRIAGRVDRTLRTSCRAAEQAVAGIGNTAKRVAKVAGAAFLAVAAGAVALGTSAVKSAMEFEDTMADVAKVVDGLRDDNGNLTKSYYDMSNAILDMSRTIPMTTTELGAIMAAAGQAGIATEDLTEFTETAAKMGIAFDTTAEQAGEWMATWRSSMGLSQTEVAALGDQINLLGNTTSESALKLSEVVTRVGALGQTAGLTGGDLAALAASMPGVSAEVSATGIKNLMLAMTKGASATGPQQKALERLGMSATDLAERMQTDAKGAIVDLLGAMNRLPEAERAATLSQYFGTQAVASIAPLMTSLEGLEEQFAKVSNAEMYAGSMEEEYAARAATTSNAIQLTKNRIEAFKIKLGTHLLPVVGKVAEAFGNFADKLTGIVETHGPAIESFADRVYEVFSQKVVPALVKIFGWLGKVASFMIKHRDIILALVGGFAAFYGTLWAVTGALKGISSIMRGVKVATALLSSPLGMTALVIGALVAVGILLYRNWDTIKAKAQEVWGKVTDVWNRIKTGVTDAVSSMVAAFQEKFPIIYAFVSGWWENIQAAWGNIKAIFSNIIDFVKNVFAGNWGDAWQNIVDIFANIFGLLTNLAKAPINGVISAINHVLEKVNGVSVTIPDWVPGVGGKTVGFDLPKIPTLATGGIATAATLAMIGEGGEPEAILPLSKLADMLKGDKSKLGVAGNSSNGDQIVFAPVFHLEGSANKTDVEAAVRVSFDEFKKMYERLKAEERRKSFSMA